MKMNIKKKLEIIETELGYYVDECIYVNDTIVNLRFINCDSYFIDQSEKIARLFLYVGDSIITCYRFSDWDVHFTFK